MTGLPAPLPRLGTPPDQREEEGRAMGRTDQDLDNLFRTYRAACPEVEPGPNFMPEVWQKIEARRTYSRTLKRWTGAFVTAAAALCVTMAVYTSLSMGPMERAAILGTTYVEALNSNNFETSTYEELMAATPSAPQSIR